MHFHILGAGAIGLWTGYHLRRHGHRVTLLLRSEEAVKAFERQRNSIRLITAYDRSGRVDEVTGVEAEIATSVQTPIERVLITTKAHHTCGAFATILPRLTEQTSVILLQNGMGVREQLLNEYYKANTSSSSNSNSNSNSDSANNSVASRSAESMFAVGVPRFAHGITSIGCIRAGINEVIHTGTGALCFGPAFDDGSGNKKGANSNANITGINVGNDNLNGTLFALHEMKLDSKFPSPVDASAIHVHMFTKLVVNACINPVTALLGCSNGQLYENTWAQATLSNVCDETSRLLQLVTSDSNTSSDPLFRFPLFTKEQREKFNSTELLRAVLTVCRETTANRSSMLVDIESGRTTEIDYINGYLVRLGGAFRCATPLNEQLQQLVHARSCLN